MILTQQPQTSSPVSSPVSRQPTITPASESTIQPLTWLWPGRIPQGKLTLLDSAPDCGTTLFALTLAAHISTGQPWPDGTPCPQGNVLLITPHDNFRDTLLPRLKAAGAQSDRVLSLTHVPDTSANAPHRTRPFSFARDLALLERAITTNGIVLLIIDPYTALPGWRRALPALIDLAQRTHCAILLTRSLSRAPSDPLHPRCPASTVLTAARSHLLLAPDPRDERHCLLLTPKHSLCAAPPPLAYTITTADQHQPLLSWLPAPDLALLHRLCSGPIRSPHRRAILRFLHECPNPCSIKDILAATCYDYEAGLKMLVRMQHAGELVSLDRGLYTTSGHPCLANFTSDPQTSSLPAPVSSVPDVPDNSSTPSKQGPGSSGMPRVIPSSPRYQPTVREKALTEEQSRVLASFLPSPIIIFPDVPGPSQHSSTTYVPTLPTSTQPLNTRPPQSTIPSSHKNLQNVPTVPTSLEESRLVKI